MLRVVKFTYPGVAQLVARLLWEQDAASSSLATRTNDKREADGLPFIIGKWKRGSNHLNATVRWTVARCGLDRIDTLVFIPPGNENANESRHSEHLPMKSWIYGP